MSRPPAAATASRAPEVFEKHGWKLEAYIQPLTRSDEIDELAAREKLCKVPDMYCGGASLRLTHLSTKTLLELDVLDALRCCRWDPPPPLSQQPIIGDSTGPRLGSIRCQFADRWRPQTDNPDVRELQVTSDWTCSTSYWGSTYRIADGERRLLDSNAWQATEETLPMELLRRQDEISWYQEILFWEDELADNGLCRLSVRVRVMPSFWFVLLLCEMRVDNVLLREVATRLFCSFDSDYVLREWTWKEATYEALQARGVKIVENPQISHESIGTVLLSESDVRQRFRERLPLSH